MADKYILRVTAGPSYDLADHTEVPVNSPTPVKISTEHMDVELNVRIQNYHGLPRNSPATSPYFDQEPHSKNKDQYSIAFQFTPKAPGPAKAPVNAEHVDPDDREPEGISASDLQFGNDFDHPIRDRLPPGFSYAMKIVKWWIDPGLDGDPYADSPYLFGPALSSFNHVRVSDPPPQALHRPPPTTLLLSFHFHWFCKTNPARCRLARLYLTSPRVGYGSRKAVTRSGGKTLAHPTMPGRG